MRFIVYDVEDPARLDAATVIGEASAMLQAVATAKGPIPLPLLLEGEAVRGVPGDISSPPALLTISKAPLPPGAALATGVTVEPPKVQPPKAKKKIKKRGK